MKLDHDCVRIIITIYYENSMMRLKMSIIEWFFIGAIILFFVIFMFYSWTDLLKDKRFYKEKKKNVSRLDLYKKRKRKAKK